MLQLLLIISMDPINFLAHIVASQKDSIISYVKYFIKGSELTNNHTKPKLTIEEQIRYLRFKGIKFEKCSELDAAEYLSKKKTTSARIVS